MPPFLSKVRAGGPTLWFSYEATAGELRHMIEVGLRTKVKADASLLVCDNPWTFRLDDEDGLAKLLYWLKARDPRLCILDPLRDFHSLDEKDSGDMNRLLRPLRQWAVENNSCVLIVHHSKKKEEGLGADLDAGDLRGSSALFGIADGVLMVSPRTKEGLTKISATFKRAKGWVKSLQLAAYDKAEELAHEKLESLDGMVLKAVSENEDCQANSIAKQLNLNKLKIADSLLKLEQNGLIKRINKKWVVNGH